MFNYQIVIPTYNRPELIQKATLAYLERCNVDPARVDIWISGKSQEPLYEGLPMHWRARFRVGVKGLMANRAFAEATYLENTRLLWVNDDIFSVSKLNEAGDKLEEADIHQVAERGFAMAHAYEAYLWGIYAVNNAFYMSHRDHLDLRYIVGCFYGVRLRKVTALQPRFGDAKEDYERAMRFYQRDDRILRMDRFAPKTIYYNSPEIFPDTTHVEKNIRELERVWPMWVKRNTRRKSKYPEILIRDPNRKGVARQGQQDLEDE